jgi:hypothetical protein
MANRLAGVCGLIVFAAMLIVGRFVAHNDLSTTILRALVAMLVMVVVGYVLGTMAEKMLEENLASKAENPESNGVKSDKLPSPNE